MKKLFCTKPFENSSPFASFPANPMKLPIPSSLGKQAAAEIETLRHKPS